MGCGSGKRFSRGSGARRERVSVYVSVARTQDTRALGQRHQRAIRIALVPLVPRDYSYGAFRKARRLRPPHRREPCAAGVRLAWLVCRWRLEAGVTCAPLANGLCHPPIWFSWAFVANRKAYERAEAIPPCADDSMMWCNGGRGGRLLAILIWKKCEQARGSRQKEVV